MSLLDPETLKQVGNFAIEFNTLNDLITTLAAISLECAKFDIAEYLISDFTAGRKLELIEKVAKMMAGKYGLVQPYTTLKTHLLSARHLVENRNTIIHGDLTVRIGEQPIIQSKKQQVTLTPQKLAELVQQIDETLYALMTAHNEFMIAVCHARSK